jgi:hypothetical protein
MKIFRRSSEIRSDAQMKSERSKAEMGGRT